MAQKTNLNVSPYFDDYNSNDNYYKVLFSPGKPVQARELNNLQSILQNQIESFGSHIFKEGSVVIPGNLIYDSQFYALKLNPTNFGIDISTYINNFIGKKIIGDQSGISAVVQYIVLPDGNEVDYITLYVKYIDSDNNFVFNQFTDGESLYCNENITYGNTTIVEGEIFATAIDLNATSIGSAASIGDGVYFVRGAFVKVNQETIILDYYTNTPSYRIGLKVDEQIITSKEDSSLYDNAKGFNNFAAPGADRFKISLSLTKKDLTDIDDTNFIELLRVDAGKIKKVQSKTDYNLIKDYIAQRTYDESGDYVTSSFGISVNESLNNRLGNNGLFFDNERTEQNNTPSDELLCIKISPGKAYVRGYDVEKSTSTIIDVEKTRETETVEKVSVPFEMGNLLRVNNVLGTPVLKTNINLQNKRIGSTSISVIGKAKVYNFKLTDSAYNNNSTNWDLHLFDIQTYTVLTSNQALSNTELPKSSFVKGKSSGASGYAVNAGGDSTTITLSQTSGSFIKGEQLLINGVEIDSRTIQNITVYSTEDIKSVNQSTNFSADSVLEFRTPYGFNGTDQITITDAGITTSPGRLFSSLKPGNIIRYVKEDATLPTYNIVDSIDSDGLSATLEIVPDVSNVNDGTKPLATIKTLFSVGYPIIQNEEKAYLYTKLPNQNISSVDLSYSSLVVSSQTTNASSDNSGVITLNLSNFGVDSNLYSFMPFDEERYSVIYNNGTVYNLTSDKFSLSLNSKQINIYGLDPNETNIRVNATLIKSNIQSKNKVFNRSKVLKVGLSKYPQSGSNINTTINDGLTYNSFYGLRIQDEEISLNVPDAYQLVKVYESLDKDYPVLDQLNFSAVANIQTNAIIGEKIIGLKSNSVARVVANTVGSPNNLDIVYLNANKFIIGEEVKFEESNIQTQLISTIDGKYKDITNNYILDKGQKDQYYDYSRIVRNTSQTEPSRKLSIIFDYYTVPSNDTGDVFTVLSYSRERFKSDIPNIGLQLVRASDTLDFRPRVSEFITTTSSPFDFDSRNFGTDPKVILSPNENCLIGYSYYLPRIDKIYLDKLGNFVVEKGVSSIQPKAPIKNDEVMELATIFLPAYLYNSRDALLSLIDNRRYTMRDIGKIENRVENLERVTSLSLLEVNTQTLQIQDAQGFNRFRTGIFVDDFKNTNLINLNLSSIEIDQTKNELIPPISKNTLKNQLIASQEISDENLDYSTNFPLLDENVQKTGNIVTLKYEEIEWIKQPLATKVENVNPFHVVEYNGIVRLNPNSDSWVRTITLPDNIITNTNLVTIQNTVINNENVTIDRRTTPALPVFRFRLPPAWLLLFDRINRNTFNTQTTTDVSSVVTGVTESFSQNVTETSQNNLVRTTADEFIRSRNTEYSVSGLKPFTRYYQFFDGNSSVDFVPKLIEIATDSTLQNYGASKNFIIGEKVTGYFNGKEIINFRLAKPNHKFGKFDQPSFYFNTNPYFKSENLPEDYSASSKVLNIDTSSLSEEAQGLYSGYLQVGTQLIGERSGAVAYVKDLRLISDNYGDLIGTFFIRNPYTTPAPPVRITTGNKTFVLSSSPTNQTPISGSKLISKAQANYNSQGTLEFYQTTVNRNISVTRTETSFITRTTTRTLTTVRRDPLAQSFTVGENIQSPGLDNVNNDSNGAFLSGVDVFFANKDSGNIPVTLEIRTMELGTPTLSVIGNPVTLRPEQVNVSSDASIPTRFTFDYPLYLPPGREYAITLLAPESVEYEVWIAEMGEKTVGTSSLPDAESVRYTRQFAIGSLFKSQNGSIWSPNQYQDLKFILYKCNFTSNKGTVFFNNPSLDVSNGFVKNLISNPITTYPRKLKIETQEITDSSLLTVFTKGRKIGVSDKSYVYGYIEKTGSSVSSDVNNLSITNAGSNYVNSFAVSTYNISGNGSGLTFDISTTNGSISGVTLVDAGKGYSVGDVVGIVTSSAGDVGSGAIITISKVVNSINTLYLSNVQGESFSTTPTSQLTYYNSNGSIVSLASTTVTSSTTIGGIYDGNKIKVIHGNHGMYANNNKLLISGIKSNLPTTSLTSPLVVTESSTISIADTSNFSTFEGIPVDSNNPGFIKVNNEIIKYTSVSPGLLSNLERGKDNTTIIDHPINSPVQKYELNGISLLRINRQHDIDDNNIDLDGYFISIDRSAANNTNNTPITDRSNDRDISQPVLGQTPFLSFNSESTVGGDDIYATENICFTKLIPSYETISPGSATEISAQIRTVSGTSASGSETSFNDLGYEPVQLNRINNLSSTRLICSKINENTYLTSLPRRKSFTTALTFSTSDNNLSPFVFIDTCFTEYQFARLNSPIKNYVDDNRVNSIFNDPHAMIYVSNTVRLSQPSTSLKVIVSAYRHSSADFRVLYNLIRPDSSEVQQSFELFPGYDNLTTDKNQDGFLDVIDSSKNSGLPDVFVTPSLNGEFLEYEFTASNLGLFTGYTIKIVASGTNQAYYPRFADLRSIAIR